MKSAIFSVAISQAAALILLILITPFTTRACGQYTPYEPATIRMFRTCTPLMEEKALQGRSLRLLEKEEICRQWQLITSPAITTEEIETVVYSSRLKDMRTIGHGGFAGNRFAEWLSRKENRSDLDYLLLAKEIEELRSYMRNPWYYPYEGDEEHDRLTELKQRCRSYRGSRHEWRYALQLTRLMFTEGDYNGCIRLWESMDRKPGRGIVADMVANYAAGAYLRTGNRDKAVELYTRCEDIVSLCQIGKFSDPLPDSPYSDPRVRELEVLFSQFPDSPLLAVKLQQYGRAREKSVLDDYRLEPGELKFYDELKRFAKDAANSPRCKDRGMWGYAAAFLTYLDGDETKASRQLSLAEKSPASTLIKESIRALRFLLDSRLAADTPDYRSKLLRHLKWVDACMARDIRLTPDDGWQWDNKLNISFFYWQDVVRKVVLGRLCPRLIEKGATILALQLANYACNRIHQLSPLYTANWSLWSDEDKDFVFHEATLSIDEYRNNCSSRNDFDYSNRFFELIDSASAAEAARYARSLVRPADPLARFLNRRSYVDADYINEIVGTHYLREMNFRKAVKWLGKVSPAYQARTNLAKMGYFLLDPFRLHFDGRKYIADSSSYKMRFAREMVRLERLISSRRTDPNVRAKAKLRYAAGLRNAFGPCWSLTAYLFSGSIYDGEYWCFYESSSREGFAGNPHAARAYKKLDKLVAEALGEFTDPEQAAQAHLELMNFKTIMKLYASTATGAFVRGHCDSYHDYTLNKL